MKLFILAMGLLIFNILDGTFIMFSIWETTDKSVFYALHSLVFCDRLARIRHITWPGSIYDNKDWTTSKILEEHTYFSENEYLLGETQ